MSTATIRWVTTLVGGAVIGILAVAATGCTDDEPRSATAGAPTSSRPPTTSRPTTSSAATAATESTASTASPADDQLVGDGRTITVTGRGRTTVKPDIAHVSMGVRVIGDSAQTILAEANQKATELIEALKALGVAEDDIRTNGISIHPQYGPPGAPVGGYEASNVLDVTIRDISRAGEIIDGGAAFAGDAIMINGIWFSVADPEAVMADARATAITNARKRAAEYAEAAGVGVGEILMISETAVGPPVPTFEQFGVADAAAAAPIQGGTTDLAATVSVVFRME